MPLSSTPRHALRRISIFIRADAENSLAIFAALASFEAPLAGISPEEFAEPGAFFRFGRDPRGFDVLPSLPGVDFDMAWERRIAGVIDEVTGLTAFFISKDDLIASKLAAGRPQDLADVSAIRKAGESQNP